MAATRRRRSASGRFVKASTYKKNPAPRRAAKKGRTSIYVRNPAPKRRRSRALVAQRGRVRRSFRRNPIGKGNLDVFSLIVPAIGIGGGAVGIEWLMGMTPIPANLKVGPMRQVTKAAYSLAVGWAISKFASRRLGEMVALGGVTVAAHDAIKDTLVKFMPNTQFGAYLPANRGTPGIGYYTPAPHIGAYVPRMGGAASDGFGMYMGGAASDGYSSPAFG